jgi:hypothetical protein
MTNENQFMSHADGILEEYAALLRANAKLEKKIAALQREWVGLTDEEITQLRLKNFDSVATNYEAYRAIEAKLKEKNT